MNIFDYLKKFALLLDNITHGNSWIILLLAVLLVILLYCSNGGFFPFLGNSALLRSEINEANLYLRKECMKDNWLLTIDGQKIANYDTGLFDSGFNEEQAEMLGRLLDKHYDVTIIAYPHFSADDYYFFAKEILKPLKDGVPYCYRWSGNSKRKSHKRYIEYCERLRIAAWKIINLKLGKKGKTYLFDCLKKNLYVTELLLEIHDLPRVISDFSSDWIELRVVKELYRDHEELAYKKLVHLAVEQIETGKDNISLLNNGMRLSEFTDTPDNLLDNFLEPHERFYTSEEPWYYNFSGIEIIGDIEERNSIL